MAKRKPSASKRGAGMRFDVKLEGGDALATRLRAMSKAARGAALAQALDEGIQPAEAQIRADAPGPHIVTEMSDQPDTPNTKAVQVGPDKNHWYYQFFETGVQPFEIDMVRRRSKRTAINKKTGRRMSGRKVSGEGDVLAFPAFGAAGGQMIFAKHVKRGAMAARPFLRKNFLGNTQRMEDAFGAAIERNVIAPNLERK